jgi:hypothetical protein
LRVGAESNRPKRGKTTVAHFHVISAERHERKSPLCSYGNFDTEARAAEVACELVVSGQAAYAMVYLSDRLANRARLVHVFLDRRPRLPEPGEGALRARPPLFLVMSNGTERKGPCSRSSPWFSLRRRTI